MPIQTDTPNFLTVRNYVVQLDNNNAAVRLDLRDTRNFYHINMTTSHELSRKIFHNLGLYNFSINDNRLTISHKDTGIVELEDIAVTSLSSNSDTELHMADSNVLSWNGSTFGNFPLTLGTNGLVADPIVASSTLTDFWYDGSHRTKPVEWPEGMKCHECGDSIHEPWNLTKLLGDEETKKYLDFCKKEKTKPQLYCCECFAVIEKNPNLYQRYHKMVATTDIFLKRLDKLTEWEKELRQREGELDRQLIESRK